MMSSVEPTTTPLRPSSSTTQVPTGYMPTDWMKSRAISLQKWVPLPS